MRRFATLAVLAIAACVPAAACATDGAPAASSAQTPLSDVEIAAIQQLCETVSKQYALALDGKDPDALAGAFSEDGVWEVLGHQMVGRDEIRTYWKGRLADWTPDHGRVHQISNQVIDVIDRDHARGISKVMVYFFSTTEGANKELAPQLIARNTDEFVRTAEGWKIKRRSIDRIANVGAN